MDFNDIFKNVKLASRKLAVAGEKVVNKTILTLADLIENNEDLILDANKIDLEKMDKANPLFDRLMLTHDRITGIASDLRNVASLPSPLGMELEKRILQNGILLRKVSVPFGVIGVIYEARPNVTFDVFSLCLKSGNAAIMKGGRDAENSNKAAMDLIHRALELNGLDVWSAVLMPSTHEATAALLGAKGMIDLCIPRGGRKLIDFVRENAKVPVIETGAGVVHLYFDNEGDASIASRVIENAKTRRVSVCNALDTLLVNRDRISELPGLLAPLASHNVDLYTDNEGLEALKGIYPDSLLHKAEEECWDMEWMDYKMGVKIVKDIDEAIEHIARHGSGHSESIVTDNPEFAEYFQKRVDASSIYVNLPTSFTDGAQFGLGAEIGISTQKLGPRGPMGLREMTTYKYLLSGKGQIRP